MELRNDLCTVRITIDRAYTAQSSDNKHYDLELNPEHMTRGDAYRALSIHVDLFSRESDIALIGDLYSDDMDCAILDGSRLTVMQNNAISQIDIQQGRLLLHKRFACMGCAFGLFRVPKGFVVFGELEIVGLDLNFDRVWGFSGGDIFASRSQKEPFVLCENSIQLYDWEDHYYELDFDGNLLHDSPPA